jgi:bacterial/archaeal transporter family protein
MHFNPGNSGPLFGVVFLGERPSLNGWIGIILIAAGAVLIAVKR